jgi:putative transposase
MKDYRSFFSVERMANVLEVTRSGYYAWLKRPLSNRAKEDMRLTLEIRALFEKSKKRSGSPKITNALQKNGIKISRKRVCRIMRKNGLRSCIRKKYRVTTDSRHSYPVAPNLLNRRFTVSYPNLVWVSDITYLKVGNRWMYLVVFIDLYSRMVVSWALSDSLEHQFVLDAFKRALWQRRPPKGLMVHSDRGVQYACDTFRNAIKTTGCIQSMSRKGNCWDNAVAESFFHLFKSELGEEFSDNHSAYHDIFEYIEIDYNRQRTHETLGYYSPAIFETMKQCA